MTFSISELNADSRPKYRVLADMIAGAISSGTLSPGEKLPPQRILADQIGVTVGTVTRAYAEAERRNLVVSKVGSGTYVRSSPQSEGGFFIHSPDISDTDLSYSVCLTLNQPQYFSAVMQELVSGTEFTRLLMEYRPESGLPHQRNVLAGWLNECGYDTVSADQIMLTCGGQHGFYTSLSALARPGDTVLCEGLTYPGLINACQSLHLRLTGLEWDDEGILPDSLSLACQRYRPRLLYATPRIGNPLPATMSTARAAEIQQICRRHDVVIIEDDTQGAMGSAEVKGLHYADPENTVLVSSFSKVFGGGLRSGLIHAPAHLKDMISRSLRTSIWMTPPLMSEATVRLIQQGLIQDTLQAQQQELEARNQLVKQIFSGMPVTTHPASLHFWLQLPDHWRASGFTRAAAARGIIIRTAETFAAGHFAVPQGIRVCIGGTAETVDLKNALTSLRELLDEPDPASPAVI